MPLSTALATFMECYSQLVCAKLTRVRGSSPRDEGTFMLISADSTWGTVGGGQLEYLVINAAREMLSTSVLHKNIDLPLGPEINQCCGGHVEVVLFNPSKSERHDIMCWHETELAQHPHVYVFGAGHVGREICNLLQFMPVHTILSDDREAELNKCTAHVKRDHDILPEALIRSAPQGSAAIVLTHSHSLDFFLASEALASGQFNYVGMIGSKTKRAKFKNWFQKNARKGNIDSLFCPIGPNASTDKRPELIASFTVAEVMEKLANVVCSDTQTQHPALK